MSVRIRRSLPGFMLGLLAAVIPLPVLAQQGDGTDVSITTSVRKPRKVPADAARIAELKVAPGFGVNVFARNLLNTRILAVAPTGNVYVSRRDQGDILLLKDTNRTARPTVPPSGSATGPALMGWPYAVSSFI